MTESGMAFRPECEKMIPNDQPDFVTVYPPDPSRICRPRRGDRYAKDQSLSKRFNQIA
jgi:hypothetical protein